MTSVKGKGVFELKGFKGAFSLFNTVSEMKAKASFMSYYMEGAFSFAKTERRTK